MDPNDAFTAAMRKTAARVRSKPIGDAEIWGEDRPYQPGQVHHPNSLAFKRAHLTAPAQPAQEAATRSTPAGKPGPAAA